MYVCMYVAVNAADILNDNQGGREFYAAFAKLEDFTAVSKLWDILQVHTYIYTHIKYTYIPNRTILDLHSLKYTYTV